jgi:nitronate monooxygenase
MALSTRLTRFLDLEWPIISAPMALASGGRLAREVTLGGGLGLIGGGYGDNNFINQAWEDAGNAKTGIGFITWSLTKQEELLDLALQHSPAVIMLSFGDPAVFARKIKQADVPLMCQCQTLDHVNTALDSGADIIVAQGSEAGGHGASRGTLPFVPETADLIARRNSKSLLLAAGGIADGRGIAASLLLGADGVLMGSRYWASCEALVAKSFQQAAIAASGDDTLRTKIPDIARKLDWPAGFDIRVLRNNLMQEYHSQLESISDSDLQQMSERYINANQEENASQGGVIVGESTGIIDDIPGARDLTRRLGEQTVLALSAAGQIIQN